MGQKRRGHAEMAMCMAAFEPSSCAIAFGSIQAQLEVPRKKEWHVPIPKSYKDAMKVQINRLEPAKAWAIVDKPTGDVLVLPGKWALDVKPDPEGWVTG